VSRYVSKPHLLNGRKYDLRLYVLVTSYDPLKIYLFKDGLVRLATVPYNVSKSSLKQRFVHLTNYSVNKKAEQYVKNTNTDAIACKGGETQAPQETETMACKLSFLQLKEEYRKMGVDYAEVFSRIKDVIIKTVISVEQPIL
jgi:tubulin polyglutamylase TTLL4